MQRGCDTSLLIGKVRRERVSAAKGSGAGTLKAAVIITWHCEFGE